MRGENQQFTRLVSCFVELDIHCRYENEDTGSVKKDRRQEDRVRNDIGALIGVAKMRCDADWMRGVGLD